jgi:hypothetical protein
MAAATFENAAWKWFDDFDDDLLLPDVDAHVREGFGTERLRAASGEHDVEIADRHRRRRPH